MRKSKKRLMRSGLAGLLIASLAAGGGTLAYLTDTETADNTFTVGKVKIDLEEPNYPGNDSDEVKAIVPNQTVAKDPQIENTGNNEAIVYLKVEAPQEEYTELGADNVPGEKKLQDLFALKDISDQWELIRTETTTTDDGKAKTSYIYAYKKPLGKGETTDKLFQKVQMKNSMESDLAGKVEDIIVTAYAIQSTDVSDISLTPGQDGTLGKDVLDQVYEIFLNQSGQETPRPADEGNRSQTGKLGKITYDLDGGSLEGALTEYGTGDYGYTPPIPVKKDYKFLGWEPANIPEDSKGAVAFTATWEENHAELLDGQSINVKMKNLAGNTAATYDSKDTVITAIQKSDEIPSDAIMEDENSLISVNDSGKPIYMWFEDGVIKWWSDAEYVNAGSDLSHLCDGLRSLTDISGLANWNTSSTTNIQFAFRYVSLDNLTPLANWDTSNVTDMMCTFTSCANLVNLTGLANWDTSNVTNISGIFKGCTNLVNLAGLANWDTGSVTNMMYVFGECERLNDLALLSNWNTSKVENMKGTFGGCTNLENLTGLDNWDVSHVTDMDDMFCYCIALMSLSSLANWDTSNVTNMHEMFFYCAQLVEITALTTWDVGKVTHMGSMFEDCENLTDLAPLANWNTSSATNMNHLFSDCKNLADLSPLTNWDTGNVTYMNSMFTNWSKLVDLSPLANWNTSNAMYMNSMFNGCEMLADLAPLANWNTKNVINTSWMFSECKQLTDLIPLANWNTGKVTGMSSFLCKL